MLTTIGDRWGSTQDGKKGYDFQFWSAPLRFSQEGMIAPLAWVDAWQCELPSKEIQNEQEV